MKFLNDRAKLSGKSAFINSLENNFSTNANQTGQLSVGGELEYLLSRNGEYKFKLYSRSVPTNFYMFSAAGNVIVSGGNLSITKNFNKLFPNLKTKPAEKATVPAEKISSEPIIQ